MILAIDHLSFKPYQQLLKNFHLGVEYSLEPCDAVSAGLKMRGLDLTDVDSVDLLISVVGTFVESWGFLLFGESFEDVIIFLKLKILLLGIE